MISQERVTVFVKKYMARYDASHDFNHILRVLSLAHRIAASSPSPPNSPPYNTEYITLGALLHDVGDMKYLQEGEDSHTMVRKILLDLGASPRTAEIIQKIVTHVSYTTESKNPTAVLEVINEYPELAVVQDADRIDALGVIGIGRAFIFNGAKECEGGMQECILHFMNKLEKFEGMMKTPTGKEFARERTERLKIFRGWWEFEKHEAEAFDTVKGISFP